MIQVPVPYQDGAAVLIFTVLMAVKVSKVWPVEKYARFVTDSQQAVLLQKDARKGGAWQHYSSKEGGIQLALLESNHVMVSSGNQIYESFSLWDSKKWIKGVTKGDSILFMYRLNDDNRRFRVKFAPMAPLRTSMETCRNCIATLNPLVSIKEMGTMPGSSMDAISDSQVPLPCEDVHMLLSQNTQLQESGSQLDSAKSNSTSLLGGSLHTAEGRPKVAVEENSSPGKQDLMSIPDLAKSLQSSSKTLCRAYAETNFPTEQLGSFIRLCLTDANFPGFVEAVEKEMNLLTEGK